MKMLKSLFILLMFTAFALNANAQGAPKDYFAGNWLVTIKGVPGGDKRMTISLVRTDGKLGGSIVNPDKNNQKVGDLTKVEEKGNSVTVYFASSGTDVYVLLEKQDDNHVTGSLLDMFDATGDRVSVTKTN